MLKFTSLIVFALLSFNGYSQINNDSSSSIFLNNNKSIIDAAISHIYPLPSWHDTTSTIYPTSVTMIIKNTGDVAIGNFQVRYLINNIEFTVDTFTSNLNAGDSSFITFTDKYYSPIGQYLLTCDILLANDNDNSNDSVSIALVGDQSISIKEKIAKNSFAVGQSYPNPATNIVNINYFMPRSGIVNLSLYNTIGEFLFSQQEECSAGEQTLKLNLNTFKSGIYYCIFDFEEKRIINKIIINR